MKREMLFVGIVIWLILALVFVNAAPIPPTITYVSNSTMGSANSVGAFFNYTGNGTHAGGYIFTIQVFSMIQDRKWKAFIGNVSGRLTLDDGDSYTIYDWDQFTGTIGGEIYTTRFSSAVNWSNINCTWGYSNTSNKTVLENENSALSLTSTADNITRTFNDTIHPQMQVGNRVIPQNTCFSTKTFINNSRQTTNVFAEILLYDGISGTDGKIIYTTSIDTSNQYGYRNDTNYDFQLIVPENSSTTAPGSTPYYFYVELE
jgi:hypothetical protein